jgi:hypothetical protein
LAKLSYFPCGGARACRARRRDIARISHRDSSHFHSGCY